MHQGTCVTHVPWCMSGSLARGGGGNVPRIPGACATRNFAYLVRGPYNDRCCLLRLKHTTVCGMSYTVFGTKISVRHVFTSYDNPLNAKAWEAYGGLAGVITVFTVSYVYTTPVTFLGDEAVLYWCGNTIKNVEKVGFKRFWDADISLLNP